MPVVRSVVGRAFWISDSTGERHEGRSLSKMFNDHPRNLVLATKSTKEIYGLGLGFGDGDVAAGGGGTEAAGLADAAAAAMTAGSIFTVCDATTCHLPSRRA